MNQTKEFLKRPSEETEASLYNAPQNQIRKAMALRASMNQLEGLQHRYAPIFDQDTALVNLLGQLREEYEAVMAALRDRDDVGELLDAYCQEE